MSDAPAIPRELIGFDGAVDCELHAEGTSLRLRGAVRSGSGSASNNARSNGRDHSCADVWFSGVSFTGMRRGDAVSMPAVLQRVSVLELLPAAPEAPISTPGSAARGAFRIEAGSERFELQAGSVQVHREVAREFFGAVPPPRVPAFTRLGWALLLGLLRVPGAAHVLAKLRG